MSKAFRCDMCRKFYGEASDLQIGHSEGFERLFSYRLGIKFAPDSKEANFYIKDLCLSCAELICNVWKNPEVLKNLLNIKKAVKICSKK